MNDIARAAHNRIGRASREEKIMALNAYGHYVAECQQEHESQRKIECAKQHAARRISVQSGSFDEWTIHVFNNQEEK